MTRRSLLSLLPAAGALPDGCWIALAEGGRRWVTGQRYGHFLVHRVALIGGTHGWKCTHIPTGYDTGQWLHYRKSAVEIAKSLTPLADWSAIRSPDDISAERKAECQSICGKIRDRDNERYWEAQP